MRKYTVVQLLRGTFALLAAASFAHSAFAQSGGAFEITWSTIDGGGTTSSTGGSFSIGGTIGQPDAGTMSGGNFAVSGGFWLGGGLTSGVSDPDTTLAPAALPAAFRVMPAAPNPFGSDTNIALELPNATALRVEVTDVTGRLVRVLLDQSVPAGHRSVKWDGRDDGGHSLGAGVYFVRVLKPGSIHTQKIVRVETRK